MKHFVLELLANAFVCLAAILSTQNESAFAGPLTIAAATGTFYLLRQHQHAYHLNPAISLAEWATGQIGVGGFFKYVLAQLAGSVLAGTVGTFLLMHEADAHTVARNPFFGSTFTSEAVLAFFLCFVALQNRDSRHVAPSASLVWMVGAFAFGHLGALVFNPAWSVGYALAGLVHWSDLWLFVVPALFGGLAAGTVIVGMFGRRLLHDE